MTPREGRPSVFPAPAGGEGIDSGPLELLGRHGPQDLVAFGGAGAKTAADLREDARRIASFLPAPAANGSPHVLLVFEHDRYAMAAALLGVLARGYGAALPPNTRRDAVLDVLSRDDTSLVLHDTDAGFPTTVEAILSGAETAPSLGDDELVLPLSGAIPPGAGVMATVHTSGTTGPVTAWPKSSAELLGEARALGVSFDIQVGDRILGTVPPVHIYGLLFTVLLPLLRGAAFSRETPHHAEAVGRCAREEAANVLVTVPPQLRALTALGASDLASVRRVFSSTGPLPEGVATDFWNRHERVITEILGSTETGGIAARERRAGAQPDWEAFPEVTVSMGAEGRLQVDSPFVHAGLPRPFETADRIELHADGRFTHLGRLDGIVKIGGRRVQVQEVEDCLRAQPGIEDAGVLAVPAEGGRGFQLMAAVAPPEADVPALRTALLKRFEPTCLPRRILTVEALPTERNGKRSKARMLRLFGLREDGRAINWRLDWGAPSVDETPGKESLECAVTVPEDYAWFDGHFEAYPVLAGAVQIKELIMPTVERAFPELGAIRSMSRIKFSGRITPGNALVIRVERRKKREQVAFEIRKDGEVCSRGLLTLAASPA